MPRRILTLCSVLLFAACSRGDHDLSNGLHYKAIRATDVGTISGSVRFSGARPAVQPITVDRDQELCGSSHPNPSDPGLKDGIPGAIVYLEGIAEGKPFDTTREAHVDERNCEFLPHIQILGPDQQLVISNQDKVPHDFHLYYDERSIENDDQPIAGGTQTVRFHEAGLHRIGCDLHTWMHGYVMVADNPYYALTDRDGKYSLANVPPGRYLVKVWRDSWVLRQAKGADGKISGYDWDGDFRNQQSVDVKSNATTTADFLLH